MKSSSSSYKALGVVILGTVLLFSLLFIVARSFSPMNSRHLRAQSVGMEPSFVEGVPAIMGAPDVLPEDAEMRLIQPIEPLPFSTGGATKEERDRIVNRIIQTGALTMRVDDATRRLEELRKIVLSSGGFIADSSLLEASGAHTADITARIPLDQYDSTLAKIRALAETVFQESGHANDVTDQFVDLDARLRAMKAEEKQYLAILEQAKTIEDTLRVTTQLSQVRSRIEQLEGRLRFLSDKTEFATLNIHMTEEARVDIPTNAWRPSEILREALRDLIVVTQGLIGFTITALIFILGLLLPLGLLIWFIYWIGRRIIRALKK